MSDLTRTSSIGYVLPMCQGWYIFWIGRNNFSQGCLTAKTSFGIADIRSKISCGQLDIFDFCQGNLTAKNSFGIPDNLASTKMLI